MKLLEDLTMKLELFINELIELIKKELGNNPYEELEKSKKIISQRNFKQFFLYCRKFSEA